jgi:hypothetical protein
LRAGSADFLSDTCVEARALQPIGRLEVSEMAKYGRKSQQKVKKAMHERKEGTLRSGSSGRKVTSRKQAIAIGLSEARRAGAKVPRKKSSRGSRKGRRSKSRS